MAGRVLVVDDTPQNVKLLEVKLAAEYFDVLTADNGFEAINIAQEESPDIILLDVMMPGMDGFEVCKMLKSDPRTMHIPVVMVTALSEVEDRVKGLEAGADEFLTKPVRDLPLMARVRSLVRLKTMLDALIVREATAENNEEGMSVLQGFNPQEVQGANIAFLCDDKIANKQFHRILQKDDHHITTFSTPEALKEGLQDTTFDIAISLLKVGGEETLRVCANLRNSERTRSIPILLVAEEEDESILAKALEIGINDYILRPIDGHELQARVRTQLRRLRYQQRLRRTYRKSMELALTDELTKLYNRRYFNSHTNSLLEKSKETHKSITMLLLDIDHFKLINDTYGHDIGDLILEQAAARFMRNVRDCDLVARLGGEEFVVVMPDSKVGLGLHVAERLRNAIMDEPFITANGTEISVTISIGVACSRSLTDPQRDQLLKMADDALYRAKDSGRNRVVVGCKVKSGGGAREVA